MNKLKKVLAGVSIIACITSVFTGCGATNEESSTADKASEVTTEATTEVEKTTEDEDKEVEETTEEESTESEDEDNSDEPEISADSILPTTTGWIAADKVVAEVDLDESKIKNFDLSNFDSTSIAGTMEMSMMGMMTINADYKTVSDADITYMDIDMHMDMSALIAMMGESEDEEDEVDQETLDKLKNLELEYVVKVDKSTGESILAMPAIKKYAKMSAEEAGLDIASFEDSVPPVADPVKVEEVEHKGTKMYRAMYTMPGFNAEESGINIETNNDMFDLDITDADGNTCVYVWFDTDYKPTALFTMSAGVPIFNTYTSFNVKADDIFNIDGFEESTSEEMSELVAQAMGMM